MAILLSIDTATEYAGVCLSNNGELLHMLESPEQKNHASFVQPAIEELMMQAKLKLSAIDAVAVTAGPGSYTGLRVGLASAKGICYALNKPLILVNTLKVMWQAIVSEKQHLSADTLICPLIDARRMEAFTAVYDRKGAEIMPSQAMILDADAFANLLRTHKMIFVGSGHQKLIPLLTNPNALFSDKQHNVGDLATIAVKSYESQQFADLAYSGPLYVKEFYNPVRTEIK